MTGATRMSVPSMKRTYTHVAVWAPVPKSTRAARKSRVFEGGRLRWLRSSNPDNHAGLRCTRSAFTVPLPCRRSWVRVPSSALEKPRKRGFFVNAGLERKDVSPRAASGSASVWQRQQTSSTVVLECGGRLRQPALSRRRSRVRVPSLPFYVRAQNFHQGRLGGLPSPLALPRSSFISVPRPSPSVRVPAASLSSASSGSLAMRGSYAVWGRRDEPGAPTRWRETQP